MTKENSHSLDPLYFVSVFGIWILGHDSYPVALFRYQEQAESWGQENYRGQWLMKKIDMELPPLITEDEWKEAEKAAEELKVFFG